MRIRDGRRWRASRVALAALGFALAAWLAAANPCAAQTAGSGALGGTITDPSGALVPGARIEATNRSTGAVRAARSAKNGEYLVPLLPPGAYAVTVSRTGFETSTYPSVVIYVTETAILNVRLRIGAVGQKVSVTAQASQLQTVSSALGHITNERMMQSLPLVSRNYTQILGLSPGVSGDVNDASALGRGTTSQSAARGGYSVSGAATNDNNTQMNGVEVNDLMGSGYISGGVPVPNPDAIQEFKVQTAMYDASYGRNAGANVDVITKSGTNEFHGDVWEFLRNSALNANDFFLNASNQPRGVLDQNQFGFTFGGPIKRNKVLFFTSYQGTRQRDGLTTGCLATGNLPVGLTNSAASRTPEALASEFAGFPTFFGGVITPDSTISPLAISVLNARLPGGAFLIPAPQNATTGAVIFSSACTYTDDQLVADIDGYQSEKSHWAGKFFWFNSQQVEDFPLNQLGLPVFNAGGFPQTIPTDARVFSLTNTYVISNRIVNQAAFGFHRLPSELHQGHPNVSYALPGCPASTSGVVTLTSLCAIAPAFDDPYPDIGMLPSPEGGFNIGGNGQGVRLAQNFYDFHDSLNYIEGKNEFHLGGGITRSQINEEGFHFFGALVYPTFADFLLGNVLEAVDVPGLLDRAWRATNVDAYIQDNYRATRRLTLNLGMRYEFQGAIGDALGRQSTINLAAVNPNPPPSGTVQGYVVASNFSAGPLPAGVSRAGTRSALNNVGQNDWGPRLGFAWLLPHSQRLVLRGGYGLFYTRSTGQPYLQLIAAPPFGIIRQLVYVPPATPATALPPGPSFPTFVPYSPSTALSPLIFSPSYQPARAQDYGLNLQAELANNWLLEIGYQGARATHLSLGRHFDQALDATPSNPVRGLTVNTAANLPERQPFLGFAPAGALQIESTGNSWYNALNVSLSKRFSHGLQFLASYTWAAALEDDPSYTIAATLGGELIGNQNDPNANYGFDPFIRPQRLILSYLYDLPSPTGAWRRKLLGGWQFAGVTTFQSGDRLTITDTDANNAFLGPDATDFPNIASGCSHASIVTLGSVTSRLNRYFNSACFSAPPVITSDGATAFGSSGTSIARGPAQQAFDLALIKNLPLNSSDSRSVQIRGEFFNAFNTPSFSDPDTNAGTATLNASGAPTLVLSNTFGTIKSTSVNPRIIQLAIKFFF